MAGLADLGVLNAFNQARQQSQQEGIGQLSQAQALMGILSQVQQQQQRQAELARQQEFRGALSAAKTPEEQQAVAMRYADPKDVIASGDRRNAAEANKQTALARLTQAAAQNDAMMQFRVSQAKTAEERAAAQAAHQRFADQIAAERLKYDTGAVVAVPPMAAPAAPAPQQGIPFNFGNGMTGTVPSEEAGAALFKAFIGANRGSAPTGAISAAPEQPVVSQAPAAPNNLDARDLGAWARGPVMGQGTPPVPAPAAVPQAPAKPAEYANWPQKLRDQYDSRQAASAARASIAGAGVPTKETAAFVARQYLNGNDQAISGYARSVPAKLVIMDAIRSEAEKQGLSPEAVNARIAEFQGTKAASRTIGTRSAGIAMAAEEAQQAIQIVRDTSADFQRTNFVPWNYALKAYDTNTGRPEVVAFGASINALVNTYARALSPSGIPTVSDKEHARQILSTIQSPSQVDSVLNVINRELEIAKRAPGAVREQIRRDVTGGGAEGGWSIRPR